PPHAHLPSSPRTKVRPGELSANPAVHRCHRKAEFESNPDRARRLFAQLPSGRSANRQSLWLLRAARTTGRRPGGGGGGLPAQHGSDSGGQVRRVCPFRGRSGPAPGARSRLGEEELNQPGADAAVQVGAAVGERGPAFALARKARGNQPRQLCLALDEWLAEGLADGLNVDPRAQPQPHRQSLLEQLAATQDFSRRFRRTPSLHRLEVLLGASKVGVSKRFRRAADETRRPSTERQVLTAGPIKRDVARMKALTP